MLDILLAFALNEWGIFTAGMIAASLLIEFRLNIRRLYQNEEVDYRPILPVFIIPDWAIRFNGSVKNYFRLHGFGRITLLNFYTKRKLGRA